MKPTPHTIQWIAPHLSEGEVKALYQAVVQIVIGANERHDSEGEYGDKCKGGSDCVCYASLLNVRLANQTRAAATLFGKDKK